VSKSMFFGVSLAVLVTVLSTFAAWDLWSVYCNRYPVKKTLDASHNYSNCFESVACVLKYGLENKCSQLWAKWHTRFVCELYTDLIAQSVFLCQLICLLANARFSGFRRYYTEVILYYILNLIIWMPFYFVINRKVLLLLLYCSV
jgi:hypothetical protein